MIKRANEIHSLQQHNLRKTVNFPEEDRVPNEFVALHTYTPSSSGNTSLIDSMATLFLYLRSIMSEE